MKLKNLIDGFDSHICSGSIDVDVEGIAYDSRKVKEGYAFVCISGFKTDGHDYIQEAIKGGAVAIVAEKDVKLSEDITLIKTSNTRKALAFMSAAYFDHPASKMKLIGVTGTNGKTTTTYLIKSILEKSGYNVSLIGTVANIIGDKKLPSKNTTPESYDLQYMFNEMVKNHTDYCIMEVSSHSLALDRVAGCIFDIGIFTNLTQDHLDFHKTFENYFNAKLKLFKQSKKAAINIDDDYGTKIIENVDIPVLTYSESKESDIWATDIEITSNCSRFILRTKDDSVEINLSLPGRFNVYNALSAASACIAEGISLKLIKLGLEGVAGVPGRSEVIQSPKGYSVIIDYAHTPDGIVNILNTVGEYAKKRIITVFGCGGDRDKTKRPIMGEVAGKLSTICIVTSDNPRSEEPKAIIEDILPGINKTGCNFEVIVNRKEAIERALSIGEKDDVIAIVGKGHETYQILKDKTIHFDEREIIRDFFKNQGL